jgi:hypothetical protein
MHSAENKNIPCGCRKSFNISCHNNEPYLVTASVRVDVVACFSTRDCLWSPPGKTTLNDVRTEHFLPCSSPEVIIIPLKTNTNRTDVQIFSSYTPSLIYNKTGNVRIT